MEPAPTEIPPMSGDDAGISADRRKLPPWPLWTVFLAVAFIVGIALFGGLAIVAAVIGVAALAGHHLGVKSPGVVLASTLMQDAGLIGGSVLAAKVVAGRVRAADFGFRRVTRPFAALALGLAVWISFLVFTAVWTKILHTSNHQSLTDDLGTDKSALLWVGSLLLMGVVAPFAEEFFFRGLLLSVIWRRAGFGLGTLVSSALFGLLHAGSSSVGLLVPLAVLGVLLCLLRRRTGSIVPCVLTHAFNNSVAFASIGHLPAWGYPAVIAVSLLGAGGTAVLITRRA